MLARTAATVSASALALIVFSAPVVHAQIDGAESGAGSSDLGSVDAGSLLGGSLDDGSLEGGSAGETGAEGSGGNAGSDDGGSLDSESAEDSSLGDLVPESDETCELPDLGGSVAKFYPLFGISGVPSGVVDLVTSALGSFPNLLDVVAGPGGGAALVGQAGSLTAPLCSSIFGGEMVPPPVTVIVDTDGNLLTTVTGTTTPDSSGTAESAPTSASTSTEAADAPNTGADSGALRTSVPTPGA